MSLRRLIAQVLCALTLVSATPVSAAPPSGSAVPAQPPAHARAREAAKAPSAIADGAAMPDHVVVTLAEDAKRGAAADKHSIARALGLPPGLVEQIGPGAARVRIPSARGRASFLRDLSTKPGVAAADPDYLRAPLYVPPAYSTPNDPAYTNTEAITSGYYGPGGGYVVTGLYPHGRSWWLREMGLAASSAWPTGLTGTADSGYGLRAPGTDFPVAVIDSGLYSTHPDVGSGIIGKLDALHSYDVPTGVTTTDTVLTPPNESTLWWIEPTFAGQVRWTSHGSCVAGQVGATTNNAIGVTSAGWDSQVYAYKVLGVITGGSLTDGDTVIPNGGAYIMDSAVIESIYQAADDGARIINMSLGGASNSQSLQAAIDYAHAKGAIVVASAGNDPTQRVLYPAACDNVVAVGSFGLDPDSERIPSDFNSILPPSGGDGIDILGPGETVWGLIKPTYDEDGSGSFYQPGYSFWDGTSMAAPAVAAALSFLWRAAPFLSNDELVALVEQTADSAGYHYGAGYLDLNAAYAQLKAENPRLLRPTLLPTQTSGRSATIGWTPVSGQSVTYDIRVDGVLAGEDVSATSFVVSGLDYGLHDVSVQPKSSRNWWGNDSRATGVFALDEPVQPDATAPVASSDALGSYDDAASIAISATDEPGGSGVAYVAYRIDGAATVTVAAAAATVETSTLGAHTLSFWAGDEAGNESTPIAVEFDVVDAAGPVVTSDAKAAYSGEASVRVSAQDAGVGMGSVSYRFDGGSTVTTPGDSVTASLVGRGNHSIQYWAADANGNESGKTTKAFSIAAPAPTRIAGADRFKTAAATARAGFEGNGTWPGVDTVVVASGDDRGAADPLAAAGLVWAEEAPLLLASAYGVPSATLDVIQDIKHERGRPVRVVMVGGDVALPASVETTLRNAAGADPTRVFGLDRFATAAAIADAVADEHDRRGNSVPGALVANGADAAAFFDALSLSPVSAAQGMPILLVSKTGVPSVTAATLRDLDPPQVVVAGGTAAVSDGTLDSVADAAGVAPTRWAGADRYATAAAIATGAVSRAWLSPRTTGVAAALPDALSGGAVAGRAGGVLLLTRPDTLPSATRSWIDARSTAIARCYVFGGEKSVAPTVIGQLSTALK